jgi:hypothetical protein
MVYYVVGKKTLEGTLNSDSKGGLLNEYFELGWEYAVSHIHIKRMYANGLLQDGDTIVTLRDRMFLYQGFWNRVIAYEDFTNLSVSDYVKIVDLCEQIQKNPTSFLPPLDPNGRYAYWDQMKDLILNVKYENIANFNTEEPYCCIHIRYRGWATHRNVEEDFWHNLIQTVANFGLNVYLFGKEASKFVLDDRVKHVNLPEYASLLNNPNCKFVVGGMSGGTLVAQTFAHNKCTQYVIISDHQTLREFHTNDPYSIFYHKDGMNFSNAPIEHVVTIDSHNSLLDKLQQWKNYTTI